MNIGDIIREKAINHAIHELCRKARACDDLFALQAAIECLTPKNDGDKSQEQSQ